MAKELRKYRFYSSSKNGELNWKSLFKNYGFQLFYNAKSDSYLIQDLETENQIQPDQLNEVQLEQLEKAIEKHKKFNWKNSKRKVENGK